MLAEGTVAVGSVPHVVLGPSPATTVRARYRRIRRAWKVTRRPAHAAIVVAGAYELWSKRPYVAQVTYASYGRGS